MEKQLLREQLLEFHPKESFTVISKGRVVNISFDEVTHIRKFGYETIIYTAPLNPPDGETYEDSVRSYRTSLSLQDILNDLPVNDFFRVHKSHIVSLKHIDSIKRNKISIAETYLPVSNYYKQQMIAELAKQLNQLIEFY